MMEESAHSPVDSPAPSAAERAEAATAVEELPGSFGQEDPDSGRAADKLIVRGKDPGVTSRGRGPVVRALESVIGTDERTRILETEKTPWRMICALEIDAPAGQYVGTGWLIGPKTLLTAGHCVYGAEMGGWANSIRVVPGRDGTEQPFGSVVSKKFSTVKRWVDNQDPDFDYGVIQLPDAVGQRLGWFGLGVRTPDQLRSARVNISGYPADRGGGVEQWFSANTVVAVTQRRVFYSVDTFGGQSGSPVWVQDDPKKPPVAVGIHAYGVGGTPSALGVVANSAPRITTAVLTNVKKWLKAAQ